MHPKPKSVLVVGCGAGVTAGTFLVHPDVERIVVCEIEPLIPRVVAQHFGPQNYDLMKGIEQANPRTINGKTVEVVFDDARHYILTTGEKFDIITSDPIHPWIKGSATLYSKEYFDLVKEHLNPGGLVTQWVPLYESKHETVKSEVATFFQVFPLGTVWANDVGGEGYDTVLLGHVDPIHLNVDQMQERLNRDDHKEAKRSLAEVGFASVLDMLSTYTANAKTLEPWLKDAEINRDRNLRLQYLAGLGLNVDYSVQTQIYHDMLKTRKFPDELIEGSPQRLQTLREALR
jgi:spermidine synthase